MKLKFYLKLFFIMLKLSAFTFGGGFVIVTLMRKEFVEKRNWISEEEMTDFIAIAQSAPGAVVINTSILVGYRLGGIAGTLITVIAAILPPLFTLSLVTVFYTYIIENTIVQNVLKGMQAGISAVIADAVVKMTKPIIKIPKKAHRISSIVIILISFAAIAILKLNAIIVLAAAAVAGALFLRRQNNDIP